MTTFNVNFTAAIELTSKEFVETNRIKGRFFNSMVGHEQGEHALTAPIESFKVIDNKVYAETRNAVYHIRNLSAVALADFNTINAPVYVKKADAKFDELVKAALLS
ncbi:hypothetical protein [Vibrio phage VH7D]|uniref:Uncharacterized protein n=1 Tax=Vibrio phage VH7D TaxID=1262539 RepID=V9LYY8_9CAUD|nr:hypothetical protein CF80_gp008 [Vibrio phage VH7D]AGB06795.1 hypothetical protein [Vibrio phage VH7D]QNJ54596.1 hypothetical protein vBValMR10Z_55 [Vibrio phage vB_ValM_R10Z]QNJ54981.1 hypothetical protein vBValMR11Z_55 [Vibrio phage vB_ValM_R11Z]